MNLAEVDLNLLVSLHYLLEERSVTKAAGRAALSQPAMSHALARLRSLFEDPLLVRSSAGMVPTARAETIAEPLRQMLNRTEQLLRPPDFDPATLVSSLRIATTDNVSFLVLPQILRPLFQEAPGLLLDVGSWRRPGTWNDLERGDVDIAMHVIDDAPAGFYRQTLFTDDFVCLVRRGHPVTRKKLTLRRYTELGHAMITVTGSGRGHVNEALEKRGHVRKIALRIPSFLTAPMSVAQSDLILTLPRRMARRFAQLAPVTMVEPPLKLGMMTFSMIWHERHHHDPAHSWIRAFLSKHIQEAQEAS